MSADELFRLIFIGILVGFLPFALYRRIRFNISGERLDRWQEGAFILFGLRLSGLPWFIGGIVWMIDPKLMAWASVPIALWLRGADSSRSQSGASYSCGRFRHSART